MEDLVCIQTYRTRPEAEIAKGFLESNGISASISADDAGGAYPCLSSEEVKLLVTKENLEKAREILNTYIKEIIDIERNKR